MKKRSLLAKRPQNLRVREQLGISQDHFALFCGISKSLLSMIEINQRSWPLGKPKRTDLELASVQALKEPPDISAFEKPKAREKKALDIRFLKLKSERNHAVMALKAMTFGYSQAVLRLKVCLLLQEKYPDQNTLEGNLIGLWLHTAQIKLREASPMEQELLQTQIDSLQKKMEAVERRLMLI